ncbi:MAG: 3-deoxy-7-phosphoheptulonate synthase [Chloroflexi bacterium]|nr:3-deoxy-7-phosphoheptulonate synthase [Chloroflexota bacterium]MCH8817405.1 3-deoxy-7-phosphoheptulonate synthase [Chloroflexota bacterium]
MPSTSNVNIARMERLKPPDDYTSELPITPEAAALVARARNEIRDILSGRDDRMVMLVGPCSIHDEKAGLEYAGQLADLAERVKDRILVVMRVYFEKPRTTVGWKGLINDPNLNGTFDVANGLRRARRFLLQVAALGLPSGTEFLDPFTPQYLADLISWGAIGARTTESQTHRQMASGLSMPIGFKNGTGGTLQIAVDAMVAAQSPHAFLGIDGEGRAAIVHTTGNDGGHLILRGGANGPNYDAESVATATGLLGAAGVTSRLVIDCSHANSNKDHNRQPIVFRDVIQQRVGGNSAVAGIMLESHLHPGAQKLTDGPEGLAYGVSITDACIDWGTTEELLLEAHQALSGKVGALA